MAEVSRPVALGALICALLFGPAMMLLLAEGPMPEKEAMGVGLANDVFVGYVLASLGMILLLVAYGDNRDRPAAPVFGLIMLLAGGFLVGLWLLQSANFIGESSSSLARFFTEMIHLAPVGLGLALAAPVSLLIAAVGLRTFALDEAETPRS